MDRMLELVLAAGIIIIAAYSIRTSQDAIQSINAMNHQIQMMFVKS